MSNVAIRAEHLGKLYRLGQRSEQVTFREAVRRVTRASARRARALLPRRSPAIGGGPNGKNSFWALSDVSLEIQPGEVVGIIGRNGAGKSTLLKILSRITEPTTGLADIYGRVGSLLEVGTGFHPELTGRENIFLNGAILGMRRTEVADRFDEIVAFAELDRFIDTPVKRYSSGMYTRLAFSVAAHLDTEILLVDEVLAVGDAAFQRKCLGKMGELAGQGRTVLFVSHNMAAISRLCSRAILLRDGALAVDGEPASVLTSYFARTGDESMTYWVDTSRLGTGAPIAITGLSFHTLAGTPLTELASGNGLVVRIAYDIEHGTKLAAPAFVVRLKSQLGVELLRLSTTPISGFPLLNLRGQGEVDLVLPVLQVASGSYFVDVAVARPAQQFYVDLVDVASLHVQPFDVYRSGTAIAQSRGLNVATHRWVHRPAQGHGEDSGWIGPELLTPPDGTFDNRALTSEVVG